MFNHNSLVTEIIKKAVEDYRELGRLGLVKDGRPHFYPVVSAIACNIAFRHKLKPVSYTIRKLHVAGFIGGTLRHRFAPKDFGVIWRNARLRKTPPDKNPLEETDMSLEDAESVFTFLRSEIFEELCEFIGVCPTAVREKLGVCMD